MSGLREQLARLPEQADVLWLCKGFETSTGDVGYGLHEHGFFGPFPKYGLKEMGDGAP